MKDNDIEEKLFDTLTAGKKIATDIQFLNKLRNWLIKNTGNVNVAMRLFEIIEEVKYLKKKKLWNDTHYGDRRE